MTRAQPSLAAFLSSSGPAAPINANTPWAARYAEMVRTIVTDAARRAPRSVQQHLGPSELGVTCDRQVVGKMAGLPTTNHVADPWPSIVGTAVHAWLADTFTGYNERMGALRFLAEQKVVPRSQNPGTADLYDAVEQAVCDHKCLGRTTLEKLRKNGPPRKYLVQLLLYALGYRRFGFPVKRIVIIAYPRTESTLNGLYVWEHELTPEDDRLLEQVFLETDARERLAEYVRTGRLALMDIPAAADDNECFYCLRGDTLALTRHGLRPMRELAGQTIDLAVPATTAADRDATFVPTRVEHLGKQQLYRIDLHRQRYRETFFATREHHWVLEPGYIVETHELIPGTVLASSKLPKLITAAYDEQMMKYGFAYGAHRRVPSADPSIMRISKRSGRWGITRYFPDQPRRIYIDALDHDKILQIEELPRHWVYPPSLTLPPEKLLNWLAGYYAATGSAEPSGQLVFMATEQSELERVRDIAALCGISYGKLEDRRGYAGNLYRMNISMRDIPDWFFVLKIQARAAELRREKLRRNHRWIIESVTKTDLVDDVYCAVDTPHGAFTLVGGITTGNCPFYRPDAAGGVGIGCPGTKGRRP